VYLLLLMVASDKLINTVEFVLLNIRYDVNVDCIHEL
jgi:hypothetical protein